MKRRSLSPAIAPLFVLLVLVVQDSQLMSPFGRRFGRSVRPKNSFQRSSQAYFIEQQTSSPSGHEQRAFQYSNERPLVIEKKQVDAESVNNMLLNLLAKLQLLVYKSTLDKKLNMALLNAGGNTSFRCFVIRFSRSSPQRRNRIKLSDHICNIPIFFPMGA